MQPISSAQCLRVITLYSGTPIICTVASKIGLASLLWLKLWLSLKLTRRKGGKRHPPKLSVSDRCQVLCQITTGWLDNATEATHFINPTLPKPVVPQTAWNALKKHDYWSVVKRKHPLLKQVHHQHCLKFALAHQNWTVEDWKRVLWSDETIVNRIGSDGRGLYLEEEGGTTLWQDYLTHCQAWRWQ